MSITDFNTNQIIRDCYNFSKEKGRRITFFKLMRKWIDETFSALSNINRHGMSFFEWAEYRLWDNDWGYTDKDNVLGFIADCYKAGIMDKDYYNNLNNITKQEMNKIAKINDAIDGWKTVLDYLLSRTTTRYSTLEELKDDVNEKYKNLMQTIQTNYDRWFEGELLKNLDAYGIEILGSDEDVIVEDQDEPVDEFADEEDEQANSQIDESMFEDEQGGEENLGEQKPIKGMKKKSLITDRPKSYEIDFCSRFLNEYDIKDGEEYIHILYILQCIQDTKENPDHLDHGHFVTAVSKGQFDKAYDYADGTTRKYFTVILDFVKSI